MTRSRREGVQKERQHAGRRVKSFGSPKRTKRMGRFVANLPRRAFLLAMLVGAALITASSLAYFDFDTLPPFVLEKLPVRFESLWLASLRVHVAAALTAFPLCIALMTRGVQRRPAWHRWLGRLAGGIVLFGLVPSGIVLAFDAKGGRVVTAGFLLSAGIVAWFLVRGVAAARRRDLVAHRRAMRHVFAQMSVAVTSRALLVALDRVGVDPDVAYVVALWGPVLASAAVAELVSFPSPAHLIGRICRELSPLALAVRARALGRPFVRLGR
jgi:uncharacterized membrane protein